MRDLSTFDRLLAELDGAPGNRARACARRALLGPAAGHTQVLELPFDALARWPGPFRGRSN
jgi:hypothetical protein